MAPYFEIQLLCEDLADVGLLRHYKLMSRMVSRNFALSSGFGRLGTLDFERSLKRGIGLVHKACGRHYLWYGAHVLVMVLTVSRFHFARSLLAMDVSESRFQNVGTALEKAASVDHR